MPYDLRVRTLLSGEGRGGMQLLFRYREYKLGDGVAPAAGGAGGGRPIESLDGKASKWGVLVPALLVLPPMGLLLRRRNTCWRALIAVQSRNSYFSFFLCFVVPMLRVECG